ncbi:MAG: GGDEF domain-containing protein [Burkholderiales bacterium]|nr:GGDEF domain-containing protein [Burkholderiales bacterium]
MLSAAQHEPIADLAHVLSRSITGLLPPLLVLALAHWCGPILARHLPTSLAGLRVWGPAMVLFLGATLALTFNRGRMVVAALSLAGAYLAYHLQFRQGMDAFTGRAVYAAACVLVPLNLAALSLLHERGIFTFYGMRRVLALLLQAVLIGWIAMSAQTELVDWMYAAAPGLPLPASPIPDAGLLLMAAGCLVTAWRAVRARSALDAGLAGALVAFALACHSVQQPLLFAVYMGAGGGALAVAVLQDSFRLAFRDELTGLPSRRALNERMMALGNHYVIAMVDVDHFKRFNDTYGHGLGDHVLRMVSAKLDRVGGGARVYRFGGEEFAIVFPGKRVHQVWQRLEKLRRQIAAHAVVPRAPVRDPSRQGSGPADSLTVLVSVSVGVAERSERAMAPGDVLVAADRALYRAKHRGRNRLSL